MSRLRHIVSDLFFQCVQPVEFFLAANPAHEGNFNFLPVQISPVIQ